jgi:hypothetical protein
VSQTGDEYFALLLVPCGGFNRILIGRGVSEIEAHEQLVGESATSGKSPNTRIGRSVSCCGRNTRSGRRGGGTTPRPGFTTTTAYSSSTVWLLWLMQTAGMAAFGNAVMLSAEMAVGKPCAGKLHARFDEGPLRRSPQISGLLYRDLWKDARASRGRLLIRVCYFPLAGLIGREYMFMKKPGGYYEQRRFP